jgi:YggT family protein
MLIQILSLLLGTAASLLTLAFLARVWMQWARAPFRNPVGQFVVTFTDWAIRPLRRIIPGLFGIDLASVLAAWLTQCLLFAVMASLTGFGVLAFGGLLAVAWGALLAVLKLFIYLLMGVVILAALMSWLSPYSPAAPLFNGLAAPLLAPVRRVVPIFGGLDLSPLVVILLLQVVLIVLENLHR